MRSGTRGQREFRVNFELVQTVEYRQLRRLLPEVTQLARGRLVVRQGQEETELDSKESLLEHLMEAGKTRPDDPALQGSRRDEPGPAVGDDDGPDAPPRARGAHRRRSRGGHAVLGADGRRGRAAPRSSSRSTRSRCRTWTFDPARPRRVAPMESKENRQPINDRRGDEAVVPRLRDERDRRPRAPGRA